MMAENVAKTGMALLTRRKSLVGILRGYAWILTHMPWIRARRGELQRERRVPDKVVLASMSGRLLDGDSMIAGVLHGLMHFYGLLTGLRFHD